LRPGVVVIGAVGGAVLANTAAQLWITH
jgi:hypothetical protein